MSELLTLTDQNFDQEVLQNALPVLVDFWAPWCGPCQRMNPILPEVAKAFAGQVLIGKLDVQDHTAIPARYGIVSIPTLILFKNGQKIGEIKGAQSQEGLSSWIQDQLT